MRIIFTAAVAALFAALLAWQHLHGGVEAHHLLAQQSLPSVSNWWGLLVLPALTWFALGRMARRASASASPSATQRTELLGFGLALLFGITLAVCFTYKQQGVIDLLLPALALTALAYPIYRAECYLGFVLGLTYTVGPILPCLAGAIFGLAGATLYHVPRLIWATVAGARRRPS